MTAAADRRIIGVVAGSAPRRHEPSMDIGPADQRETEPNASDEHFRCGITTVGTCQVERQLTHMATIAGGILAFSALALGSASSCRVTAAKLGPEARSCSRYPKHLGGALAPSWPWRGRLGRPAGCRRSGWSTARSRRRQRDPAAARWHGGRHRERCPYTTDRVLN